ERERRGAARREARGRRGRGAAAALALFHARIPLCNLAMRPGASARPLAANDTRKRIGGRAMQERQRRLGASAASGARPLMAAAPALTPLGAAVSAVAQPGGGQAAAAPAAGGHPVTANWTTADDHADMMRQLGITKLRPGPSGQENAPNAANYDEALANP